MVKTQIIIFLILILYSFEQSKDKDFSTTCLTSVPSAEKYVCLDLENDESEELGMHCCHRTNIYNDGRTGYECELLQKGENYDDINGFIEDEKKLNENLSDIKIDCFQKYISYNLVLLIAFLFVIN